MSAALLEEAIGHGIRTVVAVGGAGSLHQELTLGHVVVPTKALRDEGTSYHYVAPNRWIEAQPRATAAITAILDAHRIPYVAGATWTTDAFYRETRHKIAQRRAEGCLTVEMENAALLAVAQLRGITMGQILYSGDDLSGVQWDSRSWHSHASLREQLTYIAAEAASALR
jgi:uridine phosphorylase